MRLALVLSLVSSIQIFQQSAVDKSKYETISEFSIVSAAFPIGKFTATCILSFGGEIELHSRLDRCAKLLIIGAVVSILPIFNIFVTCLGRFLIGFSAGNGFICAPAVLRLAVPEFLRPANFLFLAAAFSFGTFLANSMFVLNSVLSIELLSSGITALCGLLYLVLRPPSYPNAECAEVVLRDDLEEQREPIKSEYPILFVFILMVLNVSIGVPLIQTYSTLIFTFYGISEERAKILSVVYPFLQFIPVMITTRLNVSRRILVLGGYYLALTTQFFIMITSSYTLMPEKHQMVAMCILVMFLSVVFTVPCNTGLCILFEQFDGANLKSASRSRCVMWFLSSISTLTFAKSLLTFGFVLSFLPYFLVSAISFLILLHIFPTKSRNSNFLL